MTTNEPEPKCEYCDKKLDLSKEGKEWDQNENEDFHHLKCLRKDLSYQCSECGAWWGGGNEVEDDEGNTIIKCQECDGELEERKPKLKDLQYTPT